MKSNNPPFSWPIPVNIRVPPGGNGKLIPWSQLKFNPLGLYHLRRWQGVFPTERGFFLTNQPRFEAADVAWFAAGMHEDGAHDHPRNHFHPLHNDVRREISNAYTDPKTERKELEKRVQDLTFDMATLWDRLAGGTTMILHVAGTMVPGSPPLPEYMKASVYLPPSLVNNHPEIRPSILRITQEFLETIGVTTVQNWKVRAKNDLGFSLTMAGVARANGTIYDVPQPQFRSSHYIILGQPMGTLDDGRTTPTTGSEVASPTPSPPSSSYGFEDMDMASQLIDAQEQVHTLAEQLTSAQQEIRRLEAQLELFSELDDSPRIPTATRNTPVKISASADFRTSSYQRHIYPEGSQSQSRSRLHTPRKGRVADVGLGGSPFRSTPVRPLQFTQPESTPPANEKGKGRELIADTGAELPSFSFTALVLQNYGLHSFLDQVLLIVKLIPDAQWLQKLVQLGIPTGVVSELLTAITMDEAQKN